MPVKPRKIPMRMCVGCREMKPKVQLLRVVKPSDGEAHIDRTGKAPGRGAYVCDDLECLRKARKRLSAIKRCGARRQTIGKPLRRAARVAMWRNR